jgi:hypothetical protein
MGSFALTVICPWRSFLYRRRASWSTLKEAFSDRSRFVRTRYQHSRFIRIAGLFPDAFAMRIAGIKARPGGLSRCRDCNGASGRRIES